MPVGMYTYCLPFVFHYFSIAHVIFMLFSCYPCVCDVSSLFCHLAPLKTPLCLPASEKAPLTPCSALDITMPCSTCCSASLLHWRSFSSPLLCGIWRYPLWPHREYHIPILLHGECHSLLWLRGKWCSPQWIRVGHHSTLVLCLDVTPSINHA